MRRRIRRLSIAASIAACMATGALAQKTLTWDQAKRELEASNPTLRAARIGIQESRADEITAFLRPNPDLTVSVDQFNPLSVGRLPLPARFPTAEPFLSGSYLIERRHKRDLRRESAQQGTAIAISELDDQREEPALRPAQRLRAGAPAEIRGGGHARKPRVLRPLARRQPRPLQGRRYRPGGPRPPGVAARPVRNRRADCLGQPAHRQDPASDAAERSHAGRTTGRERAFDYAEILTPLEEFRQNAFDSRADLRAAIQAVDKARTDTGSPSPTVRPIRPSVWTSDTRKAFGLTVGVGVTIPLRIFDRNQGEKARTQLDIQRNERLVEANRAQVFSDVDSAYATLQSNLILLRPYKTRYLQQAARVRETISFSYQHGGASLLDFLQAQQDYRSIQLSYLNLVGSFLSAANQMNFAVGREVIP